jgi:uncharacterized repeat protein (TIGR02543 family)
MKKLLAVLLSAALVCSLLPTVALANTGDEYTLGDFTLRELADGTLSITDYSGSVGAITIPVVYDPTPTSGDEKDITAIGDYALYNKGITSVVIPAGITLIGQYAFAENDLLKTASIPAGIASCGDYVFSYCATLESVTFAPGFKAIGKGMFEQCHALKSLDLPDSAESIGDGAFYNCDALKDIDLGAGLETLGESAFYGCDGMETITIPGSLVSITTYAFAECRKLQSVTLEEGVTDIGECAFQWCEKLSRITLPASLQTINQYAFYDCDSIETISLNNGLKTLGGGAFNECDGLKSITIPASITSFGIGAFFGCGALASVTFAPGLTKIGEYAFNVCPAITEVLIPDSVTDIGAYAFEEAYNLKKATILGDATVLGDGVFASTSITQDGIYGFDPSTAKTYAGSWYPFHILYKLTYDSKGGSDVHFGYAVKDGSISAPTNPTRTGFHFGGWYADELYTQPVAFPYTITENKTLYARWVHHLAASAGSGGSITPFGTVAVDHNGSKSFTITPNSGYAIASVSVDGVNRGAIAAYTFSNVTQDHTISASFGSAANTITVQTNNAAYGTVSGGGTYAFGKSVTVKAAPKDGFHFVRWLEGSTPVSTSAAYTFAVRANRTLKAEFAANDKPYAQAASAAYNSIKLTWSIVPGMAKYEIFRATAVKGTYARLGETAGKTYNNTGLATGKIYYYKVRPYRMSGGKKIIGKESAVVSAKPVPGAPTSVKAASAAYNSIKISWGKVSGATKYEIYRATSVNGAYAKITATAALNYTNTGLVCGKTYYYKIKALSGGVAGGLSAAASAKPVPATPASVKAARASSTSIKLTWKTVAGAIKYEIWRSTSKSSGYACIAETASLSFTNTGLATGKTYYYKVRAYRLSGSSKVYGNNSSVVYAKP